MLTLTKWSSRPPWGSTEAKAVEMETLDEFVGRHRRLAPQDDLRLGQRFCNEFIKGVGRDDLFYVQDDARALEMIREYLGSLHYLPHMPMKAER